MSELDKKRERFIRIAERRVNSIVDALQKLENCSNRNNYRYGDDDVKKIFNEIEKRVRESKARFQELPKDKPVFRLENQ